MLDLKSLAVVLVVCELWRFPSQVKSSNSLLDPTSGITNMIAHTKINKKVNNNKKKTQPIIKNIALLGYNCSF